MAEPNAATAASTVTAATVTVPKGSAIPPISAASLRAVLGGEKYVPPARRAGGTADALSARVAAVSAPSRVLHWSRVLPDMAEKELVALASPFGRVAKVLVLRPKQQALMELESVAAAEALVAHFAAAPPTIRRRPLALRYSSHTELVLRDGASERVARGLSTAAPFTVLLLTVRDVRFALTVDVLAPLLRVFGTLLRMVLFTKQDRVHGLVEYALAADAASARERLDGQCLFAGCCVLEAQPSRLARLRLRGVDLESGQLARDFTLKPLEAGLLDFMLRPAPLVLPVADACAALAATGTCTAARDSARSPTSADDELAAALEALESLGDAGAVSAAPTGAQPGVQPGVDGDLEPSSEPPAARLACKPSCVLSVTPRLGSADELFHLLSCYGNVTRLCWPAEPTAPALAQMDSLSSAQLAAAMLARTPVGAHVLEVAFAPMAELAPGPHVRELADSPLNRFTFEPAKNRRHVARPSALLHVSNLAYSVVETDVRAAFAPVGTLTLVRVFSHRGRHQALVRFVDVAAAAAALALMHNAELAGRRLRIAFSDSVVGVGECAQADAAPGALVSAADTSTRVACS